MPTPVNGVNEQIKIALQQKAATIKEQNNINDSIFNDSYVFNLQI